VSPATRRNRAGKADGDPDIAAFKNWICTEARADGVNVWYWHQVEVNACPLLRPFMGLEAEMLRSGPIRRF
jgi:hypothetical protein